MTSTTKKTGSKMPGKNPKDMFEVGEQVDPNDSFEDDGEFANPDIDPHYLPNQNLSPQYSIFIPPRTSGGKRKKSKNRHRPPETIWTIVSEQENQTQKQKRDKEPKEKSTTVTVTTPLGSVDSPSSTSKKTNKSTKKESPKKKKDKSKKKTKSIEEDGVFPKPSFLDNPIFQKDLKNWTLPRVELLYCRDPNCQINIQLWRDYCQAHQEQLAQLQVQELQRQQFSYNYPPHHHHQHHHQQEQQQHQYLSHTQSDPFVLPPDLPPPHTLTRRHRVDSIPHHVTDEITYSQLTSGRVNNHHHQSSSGAERQCSHPFHQGEEDFSGVGAVVHYRQVTPQLHYHQDHGGMHINMTLNSMNNLSSARQENTQTGGAGSSSSTKNIMPTSTSVPASSGGSSSGKTLSTAIASSTSSGGQITPTSTSSGVGDSVHSSSRENTNYSSSSSTSSASSSSEDVSSGSTSVTGFDSSESRGSSVPSSLNKPPHPNIMNNMETSNNNKNSNRDNSNHNNHHRSSTLNNTKSYGDSTTAPSSGYPSLPYIPTGYRKPGICPSCNGLVPAPPSATNHHLVAVDPLLSGGAAGGGGGVGPLDIIGAPLHHNNPLSSNNLKSDNNAFWNFTKFQHPLQRDHSFHSVGGFTLNGQYNTQVKKRRMVKFCSSHKIALVVSTFSLMVTVGLIITLILMKKRGMMDTMDMMPT